MRYAILFIILGALSLVIVAGPRGGKSVEPPIEVFPDMDRQLKVKPQKPSLFFADGRAQRPPVSGTVPMGFEIPDSTAPLDMDEVSANIDSPYGVFSRGDDYFNTGRMGHVWGDGIPYKVTSAVMKRGRERFSIYCAACHGEAGLGNGTVSKFWAGAPIADLNQKRLMDAPDGQLFDTITNGKGVAPTWTMFPYGDKITVEDRWAIVAYLRALQRSQHATIEDVPAEFRNELAGEEVK